MLLPAPGAVAAADGVWVVAEAAAPGPSFFEGKMPLKGLKIRRRSTTASDAEIKRTILTMVPLKILAFFLPEAGRGLPQYIHWL